jgi:methylmalonyl-CoA mutase cobalamin-binding domain/chain
VKSVLNSGMVALDFFNNIFTPSMTVVGEKFSRLDIFLPELMDAAETAKMIIEQVIDPLFAEQQSSAKTSKGKVLICTVQGDLHDIGKNMVSIMLQVNGFEVIDLGTNVNSRVILDRALEENVNIVGLSSLMTTSMLYMKEVIDLRDGFGHKEDFAVIVGGAPITAEYAAAIGADGFGKDAFGAVEECLALINRVQVG